MKEELIKRRMASADDLQAVRGLLELVNLPTQGVDDHLDTFMVTETPYGNETGFSLMGCVGLEIYSDVAVLRSLAVHPKYQKIGLGTSLVDSITEYARKRGVESLFLLTSTAEGFFKKRGFIPVNRENVPKRIAESVEFNSICPMSAASLMKRI